jgi:hypothetical protein
MTINGTNPFLAAQLARYRADEMAQDARAYRRARLARKNRRWTR